MSIFTYNTGVPATLDAPSDDQPLMLTNTQSINGIWNIDHYTFGTGVDIDGRHRQVSLQNIAAPAIPTGSVGVLYSTGNFPVWKNATNTYNIATYVGTPTAASAGMSFLPGGIKLIWKSQTLDNNGVSIRDNSPFVFPFGGFTTCYTVMFNAEKSTTGAEGLWIKSATLSPTGFSIKTSASAGQLSPFYYIAIGV